MAITPARTTYLYGSFNPLTNIISALLGGYAPGTTDGDVAVEILREFSPTELIGRVLVKGASGNWTRLTLPMLQDRDWYKQYIKTGQAKFHVEGSNPWEILFFRPESDESGPYVAMGMRLSTNKTEVGAK